MSERFMERLPERDTYAPRDGHRPASEEMWYCPNCGKPATAFVSFRRVIACGYCRWTFDVNLGHHFDRLGADPYDGARCDAEQVQAPYWKEMQVRKTGA